MRMSIISPLATVKIISPNKSRCNTKKDTISIHVTDGNLTVTALGNMFARKSKQASSNYGIDSAGNIGCFVPEEYRSWCTSNSPNDARAITIEVANDGGKETGYHVSSKAIESLINLLVDICKRNPKLNNGLRWKADKSLIGQVSIQNMTVHRWFKAKACPGDYLYNLHGSIAAEVNKRLNGGTVKPTPSNTPVIVKMQAAKATVKYGSKGDNAKLLQQNLNKFGCGLVVDGIFGKASTAALKAWQRAYGLSVDGIYGPKSEAKMKEVI